MLTSINQLSESSGRGQDNTRVTLIIHFADSYKKVKLRPFCLDATVFFTEGLLSGRLAVKTYCLTTVIDLAAGDFRKKLIFLW